MDRRAIASAMGRRTFLKAGSLAAFGLGMPELLWARAQRQPAGPGGGRAKSCILLFATGGPSQFETFDPKPKAGSNIAGEFGPIATSVPGVQICELLPRMAAAAQHYAIIRSTYHESNTHGVGVHYNLTGQKHAPRRQGEPQVSRADPPCIGGAVRQLRGDRDGLPAAVQLPVRVGDQNNFQWGGQHAGFLGPRFDPLMLIDDKWEPGTLPPGFHPPEQIGVPRMRERTVLVSSLERESRPAIDSESEYARLRNEALSVLESSTAWDAFLLDRERPETIERYGNNKFGRSCLVARRLVEAGVGLVTVPWMHLTSNRNFDTHSANFKVSKELLMPPVDQAFSALLEDLAQRGLLDETLVAWTGEFGRTPKINGGAGRDHWGKVYSTVLAGGGVRGGQAYGTSDATGGEPASKPVYVSDFIATIYHALGYGHGTTVSDVGGRPQPLIVGNPVTGLF